MLRATAIVRKAAVKADRVADTVTLDHENRQRRRIALTGKGGLGFLLDLDKPAVLNEGDALKLEDGRLIAVDAAPQDLLEIRAENPLRLMRVAWHIGNRHTPAEITADAIYIEDDHVLAEMVRGQGCSLTKVMRPFRPERGAYDHGHGHDHSHDHGHDHEGHAHGLHDHGHHDHGHKVDGHSHGHNAHDHHTHDHHEHGPDCGCGHDHHHAQHSHDVLDLTAKADHGHGHDHKHGHEHAHDHVHDHGHHKHDHAHTHAHDHGHGARHKHGH
jgi:urease accessory protein